MFISQLLPSAHTSKAALLTSMIEPDHRNALKNAEIVSRKIAQADKALIREFQERAGREHPNVPQLAITRASEFYSTVTMEKGRSFDARDLIKVSFSKRARVLGEALRGAQFLAEHYGYFYLTAGMLSYRPDGRLNVWISEDYFANRPQHPIAHGRFSENIFAADFKDSFGGNFMEMREFRRARTVPALLAILDRGEDIYHSLLLSEPVSKQSLICRDEALKFSSLLHAPAPHHRTLKHAESMHSIIISVNQDPYEHFQHQEKEKEEREKEEKEKKLTRTLSSPSSIRLGAPPKERSAYGSLTSQNLPRINFTYSSKDAWKKKTADPASDGGLLKSLRIRQSEQEESSVRDSSKEFLKASFPYTTTHSFSPLASFGSINLSAQEEIVEDPERQVETKKAEHGDGGMEEIGEMELQFQNLFESNMLSAEEELENLQVIMEEFESILEG